MTLDRRQVLRLYLPLALSWIFMAIESPICVRLINLTSTAELKDVYTAAFQVLMSTALFIESPVIDLLSTSTTLAKGRASYAALARFSWLMMGLCTVLHALSVVPAIYGLWTAKLDPRVAEALYWPMAMMIPWSAFIGWRRFKQGVLIRAGKTKRIGLGTALRMTTIASVGFGLAFGSSLPGIQIAAIALVCSVFAEAVYAHFAARDCAPRAEDEPISQRKLAGFHLPLTLTTMATLASGLFIAQALNASKDAVTALAGWQVALTIIWLHRTVVFALPEVVITFFERGQKETLLRRFCLEVGLSMSALMALSAALGADRLIFANILGARPGTVDVAHQAFALCVLLPLINAIQSYIRGALTALHLTVSRLWAVLVGTLSLAGGLWVGVLLGWPGAVTAAAAQTLSLLLEVFVLSVALKRGLGANSVPASV